MTVAGANKENAVPLAAKQRSGAAGRPALGAKTTNAQHGAPARSLSMPAAPSRSQSGHNAAPKTSLSSARRESSRIYPRPAAGLNFSTLEIPPEPVFSPPTPLKDDVLLPDPIDYARLHTGPALRIVPLPSLDELSDFECDISADLDESPEF